ncbi:hypothetical protein E2F43_18235 [Seongchinamella unica]|uniref:EVE domain-containing protein n=1 Tax=Seongchinamella unica TaxID=2547392 RepID=A0A4R5LNA5_9GAMM|nr:hypothetical protein [Seongchinamella unica]TDG11650.1 hypothetical protein E2F43_18235 [Seongchinamella unica]
MSSLDNFLATRSGWLFALSASAGRGSDWGIVDEFLGDVQLSSKESDDGYLFSSQVWGKVLNRDSVIQKGDGIAFYHSKRAEFPYGDRHKRRQRISLMGIVEECQQAGQDVSFLKVRIPEDVFEVFTGEEAIVWTPEREQAFSDCGLKDGPVRAFYPIPPTSWATFLSDVAKMVEEYTGEPVLGWK